MNKSSTAQRRPWLHGKRITAAALVAGGALALAACGSSSVPANASGVVWLCQPGMSGDPCTQGLATTVVTASDAMSTVTPRAATSSGYDCFYVYGTVSGESSVNADLNRGKAEIAAATAQASPFAPDCEVYAPVYRQVTLAALAAHPDLNFGPAETVTAYDSVRAGFEDFLTHESHGRPFVVIGDSQGAAMLNLLLARLVDDNPALRARLVMAIILGGNVEVPDGKLVGGTFQHIPACSVPGQDGCVIAYSSFPSTPPADSLFARPGQGVSLQSDQTAKAGLQVLCVNPAALSGGAAALDTIFHVTNAAVPTPWVAFPGLYTGKCVDAVGASWLDVTKATGSGDHRPLVATEDAGPLYGYHGFDLPLAQGNLVSDVAAAERTWVAAHRA
ncbi:MAG: DUF3089 domain-containing protein [Trebonia sp.]